MHALIRHLSKEKRAVLLCRLLCAMIWASEWFWGQSLGFQAPQWTSHPILIPCIRFSLNLVLAFGICLLVPRRIILVLMLGNVVILTLFSTYAAYFHRPLMATHVWYQWREVWEIRGHCSEIISWKIVGIIALFFAFKFGLLWRGGPLPLLPKERIFGWCCVVPLYAIPVIALQFSTLFQLRFPQGDMPRYVYAYGHLIPWICDFLANWDIQKHRNLALQNITQQSDRLTDRLAPIPIKVHVAILQLESVETAAIEAQFQGKPVMPFLRALKEESMFFRLQSFHFNGSCDMDYAAVTHQHPYPKLNPYRIRGLPLTNSLPSFMKTHGYTTAFLHGNTGKFYDRESVINKAGFDRVYFKDQLWNKNLPASEIGIRDADMFEELSNCFKESPRAFAMLVTLDTHTPFTFLNPNEAELFPNPGNQLERYFNSLRYLDRCLQKFITAIPDGTTVIIYGDHAAPLISDQFRSDIVNGQEYVGCLLYQKATNPGASQMTRQLPLATSGELNLLDVLSYVRNCITKTLAQTNAVSAASTILPGKGSLNDPGNQSKFDF